MSRPLRLHVPDLLHHVFTRGNNKHHIFRDDEDYDAFLVLLGTTAERFGVECVAYCLLSNHYHLVLVPHAHPLSRMMQQLNSTYCQRFNRRHGRVGHVLQGRFGCRIVEDGEYARTVLRYVALNPVGAGLASRPEAWPWSSYRTAIGLEDEPGFLALDRVWWAFGTADPDVGRARLADFVHPAVQDAVAAPLLFGSDALSRRLAPDLEPHQRTRDFVYAQRFAARPSLAALLDGRVHRIGLEDAVHGAFYRHGYTLAELAAAIGREPSTIWRWIRRAARRARGQTDECPPEGAFAAKIKI